MMKQSIWILLLMVLVMICVTQAKIQETSYTALKKGQTIRGKTAAEVKTRSSMECSLRLVVMTIHVKVKEF